jgi:multisubunit Na+/H+ antiporter MnhB subunit
VKHIAKFFGVIALFTATFFLVPISNAVREEELSNVHLYVVLITLFASLALAALFGIIHSIVEHRHFKREQKERQERLNARVW